MSLKSSSLRCKFFFSFLSFVFFLFPCFKREADYHRYLCEILKGDPRMNQARIALKGYKTATDLADQHLKATHPIRLGLALNYSVFCYEILNAPGKEKIFPFLRFFILIVCSFFVFSQDVSGGKGCLRSGDRRIGYSVGGFLQRCDSYYATSEASPIPF